MHPKVVLGARVAFGCKKGYFWLALGSQLDPKTTKNTHVIVSSGKFGKVTTTIENIPDENNPRTSRLAILSAIETLRSICTDEIKIGT